MSSHGEAGHLEAKHYVYLWVLLLTLLFASLFAGSISNPMIGAILIWGVAVIKIIIVAAYYMHMKAEKMFIKIAFYFGLFCVVAFIAGVYADTVLYWQK